MTTYLRAQLNDSSINIDGRWPQGYDGSQTAIFVQRIGGSMLPAARKMYMDRASIDVSCIAPTKSRAADLMIATRAWLLVMWDYPQLGGIVVANVDELVGPIWLAEPDYPPAGRYLLQMDFTVHNP